MTERTKKQKGQLALLAVLLATLVVYWQMGKHEFIIYDDGVYITANEVVKEGLSVQGIGWAFTTGHASNWHPLTWISHMIDVELFGLRPWGHHLIGLLFHLVNSILIFLVLRRMTGGLWQSIFVAALFALHPLHVESVAWAAERKDLLSTFFWMLTTWAYVRYVEHPKISRYSVVALVFALGLMAKPMLVTLPFVLLLLDYWPLRRFEFGQAAGAGSGEKIKPVFRRSVPLLLEKIPLIALAALSSVITIIVQKKGGAVSTWQGLPMDIRLSNAIISYVAYIGKMFWPSDLTVFYPHPTTSIPVWKITASVLLLVGLSAIMIWTGRQRRYLTVGWLWYLGTLVPVIGIVQVGAQAMADRYTYVPLVGLFILLAWSISDFRANWKSRKIILPAVAVALLLALSAATSRQVRYWHDDVTLFQHAIDVTKENWMAQQNLAVAYSEQDRLPDAIPHYAEAVRLRPDFDGLRYAYGVALAKVGRSNDAAVQFREAIRLNPEYAEAYDDLGVELGKQGKYDDAVASLSQALKIKPEYVDAHNNLGIVLAMQGKNQAAIAHFTEAVRLNPQHPSAHYNLGLLFLQEGRLEEAITHFSEALRINPNSQEARMELEKALRLQKERQASTLQKP